ncbi:ABC transporter permease [Rhizobium sp. VS19-DR104.2]|uniref:ABC transporter permease n=1 Tax=unclassified Rhizobium TaxID=2613769 RepID=UPI001C5B870B|nr:MULTISPECIES: ABC transporter permease [unclassified Rhizobium]MBZ5763407.1 ABC transporter permease [Rhizobium sp. VS19-DR96]MBZ5769302.1 ABC transporter permease [Rhizobium sp. VS19-DR129.2]MBZ5776889.1 ABC transporter permease [Rhizobium sp. VS19-DRK62.2]MBZ5788000.1 ABC transporter permease [Rhizobium sp. VS19-DR121]MBZ5805451.1 ABC transporter permease [Rhizobium sp. VS19-DR181]
MLQYIVRRLLLLVPVIAGILMITFLMKALIPTDAVTAMYSGQLSEKDAAEAIAVMRAKYHLDLPWYQQFYVYVRDLLGGNLGESIRLRKPVIDEIGYRYVNTIILTGASLAIALVVGLAAGILAAVKRNSWLDVSATTVGLFGVSMPAFFFGLLLILFFSVWLRWLPVVPRGPMSLLLPALALGLIEAAPLSQVARTSMIDVLGRDYIQAARARGASEMGLIFRHALPNALIVVLTLVGLQIGNLLGGAFIIETIFGWHGIGELAVNAIQWRDFTLTQAVILVSAASYLVINLAADILYAWLDPRVELTS